MKKILIITTGGTIDKSYLETEEKLINSNSLIVEKIKQIRCCNKMIDFHHHCEIDSNQMTDSIRNEVFLHLKQNQNHFDGFIITHGTDSLIETAKYIQSQAINSKLTQPIIITGAMRPLSVSGSDGYQNLVESLFAFEWLESSKISADSNPATSANNPSQAIQTNVKIVIHSEIFDVNDCKKNYQKMRFERIQ